MCRNVEWTMRYFVTTVIDITRCNGYAIAARSKIRKPPKVKCYHMGQDGRLKENQNVLIRHIKKLEKGKNIYANPKRKSWKNTNCRSD